MERALSLGSLLVLGSAWILQIEPRPPENLVPTQSDFDLARFMGRWYELAVVSTCPHYMNRKRGAPVVMTLELRPAAPERNFTAEARTPRNGTCRRTITPHTLTHLPGRFYHYIPRFRADVYSHVVRVQYGDYAVMLLLSTEQPSGNETTTLKLYSRTVDVSPAVLDDFRALVRQHGLRDDSIIMNQNEGECPEPEVTAQPQTSLPEESTPKSLRMVEPYMRDRF